MIEHLAEIELESPIQLLRLECDDLNSRTNDRVILRLVVPPNQRHLLDYLEKLPQHIDRVKQHLECLLFVNSHSLAFVVGLLRGAALDDKAVVRLQKLSVDPIVLSQPMFEVGLDYLIPTLGMHNHQVYHRQRPDDLKRIRGVTFH